MKTATITLHNTDNCGSSLQAYALQFFLNSNGIENEIINYVPRYIKNNGHPFKNFIRQILYYRESKKRTKKFSSFLENYLKISDKQYHKYHELVSSPPKADYYITGSDQLWNTMYKCGRDAAFYLNFGNAKKIAYAISIGQEKISDEIVEKIVRFTSDYKWISFREYSTVEQFNQLPLSIKADYVCDPVLLNQREAYDEIIGPRIVQERYILVYIAQEIDKELLRKSILSLNEGGYRKVVYIGTYRSKCECDYHIRDMSPSEFLSLIIYSEFIISNSFHATVFSLLYHKQFVSILPPGNSMRIKDILDKVGLNERIINCDNISNIKDISEEKMKEVDDIISKFSVESGKLLLSHIKMCREE